MALTAGTRLGPHEIADQLGAGGMGEVYRATDTRLDRTVAIKVLPEHLADDPQRRERFEREARAVSSLNHPHICTLHDIGEQDGTHYLVMELVEGDTLQQRLEKGRLPLDQALEYAIQIADALDKAHRQGVVHRDLKPGNIMITKSGTKLLDFGLAKLKGDAGQVSPLSQMPTQDPSAPLTAEGTIIGTLQYMAPEQLEGKEADARTDIFAFGAVVYEMVTGKKAFEGPTQASLIGSIMQSEPRSMSELVELTPRSLDRLIARCMTKDPDERWQTARDLKVELEWAGGETPQVLPEPLQVTRPNRGVSIGVGVILALAVLLLVPTFLPPSAPPPSLQAFGMQTPDSSGAPFHIAISPDGKRAAFIARGPSGTQLWVRSLDSLEAQMIDQTDGAYGPFWSSDSRFVGFVANGMLKKVNPDGGGPQTLAKAYSDTGGSWNEDGVVLFNGDATGLYRISEDGGTAEPVSILDTSREETAHVLPQFLPNGEHFLYLAQSRNPEYTGIYVSSLAGSSDAKHIVSTDLQASYVDGYLLYVDGQDLLAQSMDLSALELVGDVYKVAENIRVNSDNGRAGFTAADQILLFRGDLDPRNELGWYDRNGLRVEVVSEGDVGGLSLSPSGTHLAFHQRDSRLGSADVWVLDLERGIPTKETLDPTGEFNPIWSPNGDHVVYQQRMTGTANLYEKRVGQSGDPTSLPSEGIFPIPRHWSADGRFLFYDAGPSGSRDVWVLDLDGDRVPTVVLNSRFHEIDAQLSPNGSWLAYSSTESGVPEVYVQGYPDSTRRVQISQGGGNQPRWRGDGEELFYLTSANELVAVSMTDGRPLGSLDVLFQVETTPLSYGSSYDVTGDGQRFIVSTTIENPFRELIVFLGWTALLEDNQ